MKQNFKNRIKFYILFLGILISIIGCQKESIRDEDIDNGTNIFKISTISINDFKNKEKVNSRISGIKSSLKYENQNNRTAYDSIYDFKINKTDIILLEYEDYHWLTFGIERSYDTDYLENLVLKYDVLLDLYEAFIAKYDITLEERETIKNGGTIENLKYKTEIYPIKDYKPNDLDRTGIYVEPFTNACYVMEDIVIYSDGSYSFTKVYVPCPGGGSNTSNNGGDDGNGNNNQNNGDNWHDGNDGSNFPDDTDTNSGGSSSNNNNNDDNVDNVNLPDDDLDDTVASIPNTETKPSTNDDNEEEIDHCEKLSALNLTDSLSVNIVPYIDSLKTKTGLDKEYSISFQKKFNYGEFFSQPDPAGIREGSNSTSSPVRIGSTWFGQAHTHPDGTHYMFSWNDVNQLNNLYNGLNNFFDRSEVFLMIVNHDGTVYALKIDSPNTLNTAVTEDIDNAEGNTIDEKVINLNEDLRNEFDQDEFNLEHIFLKRFRDFGISIYKAANEDLSNWNKLGLSPDLLGPNIIETPCN